MHKHDQESLIITTLEEGHTITAACKRAGVSRQLFYRLCKSSAQFRKKVEQAKVMGNETFDDLVKTVYHKKIKDGDRQILLYALKKQDAKNAEEPPALITQGDIRLIIDPLPEPFKSLHYSHLRDLLSHSLEFERTGKIDPPHPDGL
jgi:hypothetical protein